jgi:hypothetical protein
MGLFARTSSAQMAIRHALLTTVTILSHGKTKRKQRLKDGFCF